MYVGEVPFWTHRPLWQLLYSGKFDKFPGLKYCVVECGSYWIADLLWKADVNFGASWKMKKMGSRMKGLLTKLPSEYFGESVFIGASTMSTEEIRRRHVNSIDSLMWGTDYPHPEGSWPKTRERLENDFREVSIEDARQLLGLNAVDCYNLDFAGLTAVAERIGPTPDQLGQDPDLRTAPDAGRTAQWWLDEYDCSLQY
jgi:predicted TIM-barrel fold metal-dependent hydrolase